VAGLLGDSAAPPPRTRRQAVPAAASPQRRASTEGRAVLHAPGCLSPRKITIKGACGAPLMVIFPRQDLGTYRRRSVVREAAA
jgi:hypothetical protein